MTVFVPQIECEIPDSIQRESPHLYLLLVQVKTMALIFIAPFLAILAVMCNVYFLLFGGMYAYYF